MVSMADGDVIKTELAGGDVNASLHAGDFNGDDYVEITNYGPATMDVSCLKVERIGGNNEVFVVPDGVVLGVGQVLTIHYGDGPDAPLFNFFNVPGAADLGQSEAAAYVISIDTIALDVL